MALLVGCCWRLEAFDNHSFSSMTFDCLWFRLVRAGCLFFGQFLCRLVGFCGLSMLFGCGVILGVSASDGCGKAAFNVFISELLRQSVCVIC